MAPNEQPPMEWSEDQSEGTAPDEVNYVGPPGFTNETLLLDLHQGLWRLYNCAVTHRCMSADMVDGKHYQDILDAVAANLDIEGLTAATPVSGDEFVFSDISDSDTTKKVTLTNLALALDGLIKIDDLALPDDNTDLDATTLTHGLLPKLGGGTTNFLRADGSWAEPAYASGDVTAAANMTGDSFVKGDDGAKGVQDSCFKEGTASIGSAPAPDGITLEAIAAAAKGVGITIKPAAGVSSNNNGGYVIIDGAAAHGSGTNGIVSIGITTAESVIIGRSGKNITTAGGVQATGGFGAPYESFSSGTNTIADTTFFVADSGSTQDNLPATPRTPHTVIISTFASKGSVTISGNGNNIDGSTTYVQASGTCMAYTYTGSEWKRVQLG